MFVCLVTYSRTSRLLPPFQLGDKLGIPAPGTQLLIPVILMPLALLVCFVQTLVFTLLSMIYLSEVSHAPHDDHEHEEAHGEVAHA